MEEAEECSMDFAVAYDWADDHGLLPGIISDVKLLALTGKNYVAAVWPPVFVPAVLNQTATGKMSRILTAENYQAKLDYAVTEGFRSGFGRW